MRIKIILCIFFVALVYETNATMLYTTVASGVSQRGSFIDETSFDKGFLSPVIETGARIDKEQWMGFYVRFLIDPTNTSFISSYYICAKWNYYYFAELLYVGISGGMHIESMNEQENEEQTTLDSVDAQFLFNVSVHSGISIEIMRYRYVLCEVFVSYSIGKIDQWSVNATIGLMTMF